MEKLLLVFLCVAFAGCGPVTGIGSLGWYSRYDMSKSDLNDVENIDKMAMAITSVNPKVAIKALRQISSFGARANSVAPQVADALFLDSNRAVRNQGNRTLAIIGYQPEQILPSIRKAFEYDNDNVQLRAVKYYMNRLDKDKRYHVIAPDLIILSRDDRKSVSDAAKMALNRIVIFEEEQEEFVVDGELGFYAYPQKRYFNGYKNVSPIKLGILPVDIVLSNQTNSTFTINPGKIYLLDSGGLRVRAASNEEVFNTMHQDYGSPRGAVANGTIKSTIRGTVLRKMELEAGQDIRRTVFFHVPPSQSDFHDWIIRFVAVKPKSADDPVIVEMNLL